MITVGLGAIATFSRKKKINGKSSMEVELIGGDDILPQILWTRYFMENQGYKSTKIYYFKIKKVPYYWKKMERYPAQKYPNRLR